MSITVDIDQSIPMSDEDFAARLTSALASLEGCSPEKPTDEVIARHLFEAGDDEVELPPQPRAVQAQTEFFAPKVIRITKLGDGSSGSPTAEGSSVREWSGVSTGCLVYSGYTGSSRFVARNNILIPGWPDRFLAILFYSGIAATRVAVFVGNAIQSTGSDNFGCVEWTS